MTREKLIELKKHPRLYTVYRKKNSAYCREKLIELKKHPRLYAAYLKKNNAYYRKLIKEPKHRRRRSAYMAVRRHTDPSFAERQRPSNARSQRKRRAINPKPDRERCRLYYMKNRARILAKAKAKYRREK